jgi:hypothetical protein
MVSVYQDDHIAAGWNANREYRWIEAGRVRLDEDRDGAFATIRAPGSDGPTWLSATELAGLSRHLACWFIDDPAATMRQIEGMAAHVKTELDAWDDRARIDEEHPPYAKLVRVLDDLIGMCRRLREEGPFAARAEETPK